MARFLLTSVLLLLSSQALAGNAEIEQAQIACGKDYRACAHLEELRAKEKVEQDRRAEAEYQARRAEEKALQAQAAADAAADREREAARAKKCGKDYQSIRVGMRWKRVQECSGAFDLAVDDARFRVYQGDGATVRVEHGRVTRVIFR